MYMQNTVLPNLILDDIYFTRRKKSELKYDT